MRRDAHRGIEDLFASIRPCAAGPPGQEPTRWPARTRRSRSGHRL